MVAETGVSYVATDGEIRGSDRIRQIACSAKGCRMARGELGVEHLLRRAGFGASQDDLKRVLDGWLGANSPSVLGGDFRAGAPPVV